MNLYVILLVHENGELAGVEPTLFKKASEAQKEIKRLKANDEFGEYEGFEFFVEEVYLENEVKS